jgi:hypothetical protein
VDLNLNTLKREILEYLESSGLTVFHSNAGTLEGPSMVLWDVEHFPDYRRFVDAARNVGSQLIIFATREFDTSDIDDLGSHLDEMGLDRDERRDFDSRLRELRIYQGVTCSLELAFDHNSRFYVFELQPDWYEDFLNLEDEIMSRFAEEEGDSPDETLGGYFSKN